MRERNADAYWSIGLSLVCYGCDCHALALNCAHLRVFGMRLNNGFKSDVVIIWVSAS